MKTILCYGDSYVWGCIPGSFNAETGLWSRYTKDKRWTGILQKELGENYEVVTEGINGRTTTLDEVVPGRPYKNGLTQLPVCLEAHYPIDLVIFMLGTNDTKIQFNRSVKEISEGMRQLIHIVKASNKGALSNAPEILLLAAQPTIRVSNLTPQRDNTSIRKSLEIAALYEQIAEEENCNFLDLSFIVNSSTLDGVHLDESANKRLGHAIAELVRQILL